MTGFLFFNLIIYPLSFSVSKFVSVPRPNLEIKPYLTLYTVFIYTLIKETRWESTFIYLIAESIKGLNLEKDWSN